MDEHEFPDDLTGHFWTRLEHRPELDRWAYEIVDYQGNVMASGLAFSERQAAAFVHAWDRVVVQSGEDEDPSMGWPEE